MRARRVARGLAACVSYVVVFLVAAVCGALLHVNLPGPRRLLVDTINGALEPLFVGRLHIESIARVTPREVVGARARVTSKEGKALLFADGTSATIDTFALVRSLLTHRTIEVALGHVHVSYAEVALDHDGAGNFELAEAFAPLPSPPPPPGPPSPPGPGVHVAIPEIAIAHAWMHGTPAEGAPHLDFDGDALSASFELHASSPVTMKVNVRSLDVTTRGLLPNARSSGHATAAIHLPANGPLPMGGHVTYRGDVAGIPLGADVVLDDERIDATIDVPHATPEAVRAIAPGAPLTAPVAAKIEAHGPLLGFDAKAHVEAGERASDGSVDVTSRVALGTETDRRAATLGASGQVDVHALDVRAFSAGAPASAIGGRVRFDTRADAAGARGAFDVKVSSGRVADAKTPALHLHGDFSPEGEGVRVRAQGAVDEPGLPTDAAVELHPTSNLRSAHVDFDVSSAAPDLRAVARVKLGATGRAWAHVKGSMTLATGALDVDVSAHADGVAARGAKIEHADLQGTVRGTTSLPRVDVSVDGEDVHVFGTRFAHATAAARGDVRAPDVEAHLVPDDPRVPALDAKASIETRNGGVAIQGAHASIERNGERLDAAVDLVSADHGSLRVDGLRLDGVGGHAEGSVRVQARPRTFVDGTSVALAGKQVDLTLRTEHLDIGRVASLVGMRVPVRGTLSVDAELHTERLEGTLGHVTADVENAFVEKLGTGAAHVEMSISGGRVKGRARAKVEQMIDVSARAEDFELAGDPLAPSSWTSGSGLLDFFGTINLARLPSLDPREKTVIGERAGIVSIEGSVGREAPFAPLTMAVSAHTSGLALAGPSVHEATVGATELTSAPPWRVTDVDVGVDLRTDTESGASEVATRLFDARGALLAVDTKIEIPWHALLARPGDARALLADAPVSLHVVTPRRKLDELPSWLGAKGFRGTVSSELVAAGTAHEPNAAFDLALDGFGAPHVSRRPPVEARLSARYDGSALLAAFTAGPHGRPQLDGMAEFQARARDLVDGTAPLDWEASAHASANGLPLDLIPEVAARRTRGELNGTIALEHLHRDASAKADLALVNLRIGQVAYPRATVKVEAKDGAAQVEARVGQTQGFADLRAHAGLVWGAATVPSLDPKKPIDVSLVAQAFSAGVAQPFVAGHVEGLDGRIDANVDAHFVPKSAERDASATAKGAVTLQNGTLQVPEWGEELHDVQGRVDVAPDGTVRLSSVAARPTTGMILAEGEAKFDGLSFRNATAKVRVPPRKSIPIGAQGVEFGEAWGDIDVAARSQNDGFFLDVSVPRWNTQLAESDPHAVQSLDADPAVHIGVRRDGKLVAVPLSEDDVKPAEASSPGTPVTVAVHLGREVQVTRGVAVKVGVEGATTLKVTDKARMTGQLLLKHGTIDVQGKPFTIDHGTVTFVEDPANPEVVVTAEWTAPDGTRVFADFVGPLKTGKVTLRSEPPRPKNEILAIILFGSADNAGQAKAQPAGVQAASAGGGFAAAGLNKAIDDLTGLKNAEVKVDTSSNNNPRPQIDVQIARDISIGVATVLGLPPPDRPDQVFGTFAWRFKPAWTLETMFGNLGSTMVDVVWRHRY